ncbi:MAG: queuosine precursor transporter [Chitinophagales bacterium]
MKILVKHKPTRLYVILGAFFVCNALVAEFIGVKIFALEPTLGFNPLDWNLFGQKGSLMFTAGVLLWPIVFVMTDVLNEYFGKKGVQFLSWLAVGLICYAFFMVFLAIRLAPADFWIGINAEKDVPNMQAAYKAIFGQSLRIIFGSVVAFLVGQIVDVFVFHKIRQVTGESKVYLRATGSTLVSQLIDSVIVLYIAFVLLAPAGQKWPMSLFLAIATVNYVYKVTMAIILTPAIYGAHIVIDKYLGPEEAEKLKLEAANQ